MKRTRQDVRFVSDLGSAKNAPDTTVRAGLPLGRENGHAANVRFDVRFAPVSGPGLESLFFAFPEPALRARKGHRAAGGGIPPKGDSLPTNLLATPVARRAADRICLAVWRRLTIRWQSHPRLRSLLMVRAARCANSGPSTPSPLVTRRNLGPNPFWP